MASVVNASGTTLGWEWHHGLDGNGNPADSIGGTFYDPVASTVGLLGPDANPYTGPYYFPAALNDSGAAVVIKSINGPASARLTVFDSTGNHDLGPILPGGDEAGLAFQSLTNGFTLYGDDALAYTGTSSDPVMLTQPVVLTLATPDDDAPTELWWAHGLPGSTGGDTIGWADPAPVELWDVAHSETISQRMAPPTFVRSNNQLEMILGDSRLVRNERIYDLNARLAPRDRWHVNATIDINNSGTILAYATQVKNPDGTDIPAENQVSQPVLLVPSVLMTDLDPADQVNPSLGATGTSVAIGFIPVAGEFQAWSELISGQDYITGEPASREWAAAGVVLGVFDLEGLTKAAAVAKAEVKAVGIAQAEIKVAKALTKAEIVAKNHEAGKAAEKLALQALQAEGYTVVGSNVTAYTSQGIRYIDHLVRINGELFAVEVKSGNAIRNSNQILKDVAMEVEGATLGGPNLLDDALRGETFQISTVEMRYP